MPSIRSTCANLFPLIAPAIPSQSESLSRPAGCSVQDLNLKPTNTQQFQQTTLGHSLRLARRFSIVTLLLIGLILVSVSAGLSISTALGQGNTALTATWVENTIPSSHEGEGEIFTVRIQFSEDLAVSYKTLRDHALQVDNGNARRFKRVNGSNSLWEIHARPSSDDPVTLTLPVTTDCDYTYAVCTADDKPFSEEITLTIPGPNTQEPPPATPTPTATPESTSTADSRETRNANDVANSSGDGDLLVKVAVGLTVGSIPGNLLGYSQDDGAGALNPAEATITSVSLTVTTVSVQTDQAGLVVQLSSGNSSQDAALAGTSFILEARETVVVLNGTDFSLDEVQMSHTDTTDDQENYTGLVTLTWTAGETDLTVGETVPFDVEERHRSEQAQRSSDSQNASGNPAITGTAALGSVLTADTSGITDSDGKPSDAQGFQYQWVRVDGTDETDIPGATAPNYHPSDDDVGKTIRVKVAFDDNAMNSEGPISSDETTAVPSSATISVPWSATMTAGKKENHVNDIRYGFDDGVSIAGGMGSLSPVTFTAGTQDNTVRHVIYGTTSGSLSLTLSEALDGRFDLLLGSGVSLASADLSDTLVVSGNSQYYAWTTGDPGWGVGDRVAVAIKVPIDVAATGTPTITGAPELGEVLTADTSGISDTNGKPSDAQGFQYKWVRVDGMDETDIPGATAPHYHPSDDDVGKTIKVEVSFQDDDGFEEGPISSTATTAVPSSATISVPWSATMTAGKKENHVNDIRYGFDDGVSIAEGIGSLSPVTFTAGTQENTVRHVIYGTSSDNISLTLSEALEGRFDLLLGSGVRLGSADLSGNQVVSGNSQYYAWTTDDPVWGVGDRVAVAIKLPVNVAATGTPTIAGTPELGEVLTADTSGISDTNGKPSDAQGFQYQWVRVDGMDETDIPGATAPHYHPSDDDVGKTIKVEVSFQDDDGFEESPISSTATGEVPSSDTIRVPWSATMTAERKEYTALDVRYGFDDSVLLPGGIGALNPATFTIGTQSNTVRHLLWGTGTGRITLMLNAQLAGPFSLYLSPDTELSSTNLTTSEAATGNTHRYQWIAEKPDWEDGQRIAAALEFRQAEATGLKLTGSLQTEATLTVVTTDITDPNGLGTPVYTYQWNRINCSDSSKDGVISGETSSTYTVVAADLTCHIQATVTFKDSMGFGESISQTSSMVTVTPATLTIDEGGESTYTVVLNEQPASDVTIEITAGGDLRVDSSSLTFTNDDWDSPQTVTVSSLYDGDVSDDTAKVTHAVTSGSSSEYLGAYIPDLGVSVTDTAGDSDVSWGLTLSRSEITEGDEGTVATLSILSNHRFAEDRVVTLYWEDQTLNELRGTIIGVDGRNDQLSGHEITVPAEQASGQVTIKMFEDNFYDGLSFRQTPPPTGTFTGTLDARVGPLSLAQTRLQITDNDEQPYLVLSVDDNDVTEGDSITLKVSLPGSLVSDPVTAMITATTPEGLLASNYSHEVYFSANQRSATTTVQFPDDAIVEDDATIYFRVSTNEPLLTLGKPSEVAVTVRDNDGTPRLVLSVDDKTATEGDSITLTVTLMGPEVSRPITAQLSATTPDGLLGSDYSQSITLTANQRSESTTVQIPDDEAIEDDATITFVLTENDPDVILADPSEVTVTVLDNDGPPRLVLSVDRNDVTEGDSITLTATLNGPEIFRPITAQLSATTPDGLLDSDYSQSITFAANQRYKSRTVQFPDDVTPEYDATITFVLTENDPDFVLGDPSEVTVTVRDNDGTPRLVLSVDDSDVTEGDSITLTATLMGPEVLRPITAHLSATTPYGLLDSDYSQSMIFATNQRYKFRTVQFPDDVIPEDDATITFVLTESDPNVILADPSEVTVTVRDNDGAPPILVTNRASTYTESVSIDQDTTVAQAFTTGAYTNGYELFSVVLDLVAAPAEPDKVTVSIYSESDGIPGTQVHTLINPISLGSGKHRFHAPDGSTLDPNTTYFVVVEYSGSGTLGVRVNTVTTETGETGWSINDQRRDNPTWKTVDNPMAIDVSGRQAPAIPYAPANLIALAGDGKVRLLWDNTGRTDSITHREFRQSTDGGDTWSQDWTDIPDSGSNQANESSYTLTGLDNDTTYTFQLRAENSAGHGDESGQASATPRAAVDVWTATMNRHYGCSNGSGGSDRCDNSAALSSNTFTYNGRDYQIVSLTVNDYGLTLQIEPVFPLAGSGYTGDHQQRLLQTEADILEMDERMALHIGNDVFLLRERDALNHGSRQYGSDRPIRVGGRYYWQGPGLTGGNNLNGKTVKLNTGAGLAEDTAPPTLDSGVLDTVRYEYNPTRLVRDPRWVVLDFSEVLDWQSVPDPSAFTVTVAGTERIITDVIVGQGGERHRVSGGRKESYVELRLSENAPRWQEIRVSYTPPDSGALMDRARNRVAAFTNRWVDNSAFR